MTWNLMNSGFRTGAFNMAVDEQLALRLARGDGNPTLRIYAWRPYTLSVGFNQSGIEFDAIKLQQAGIDIVRRPTGGRAILHAHELTYSVVMNSPDKGPRDVYQTISSALLSGLRIMGIDACLTGNNDDFRKLYQNPSAIPCFSSSAKYEIQFDGKKLVGSAQRRYGRVVLQHGSLLLGTQHRSIVDFLSPEFNDSKETLKNDLETKTTEVETILGRTVSFEEATDSIIRGFEKTWNVSFAAIDAFHEQHAIES